jgi:hypothetical protein
LVANNLYFASAVKQSPGVFQQIGRLFAEYDYLLPFFGELTQFTICAHKIFDTIRNDRTTTIDHIISKAIIRITVIAVDHSVAPRVHEQHLVMQHKFLNLGVT